MANKEKNSTLNDNHLVQKSTPLLLLWKSGLTLAEFKILDIYLSRINSHDPENRKVKFTKGEFEKILGLTRVDKDLLSERLDRLMGHKVSIEYGNGKNDFDKIVLFERARCKKVDGLWEIELECTQSAKKYIFNIENIGYLKYRLKYILSLSSRHTYILFLELERNRFRGTWEVNVDTLRERLGCTDASYTQFKVFNDKVLKKCQKELSEKSNYKFNYELVKRGRNVVAVRFRVDDENDTNTIDAIAKYECDPQSIPKTTFVQNNGESSEFSNCLSKSDDENDTDCVDLPDFLNFSENVESAFFNMTGKKILEEDDEPNPFDNDDPDENINDEWAPFS